MQSDYTASGDFINGSEPSFPVKLPYLTFPDPNDSSPPPSYIPPCFFDDIELLLYVMRDGPRLPPATWKLYFVFARVTNPETGYSDLSHEQLAGEAGISISSLKEHVGYLEEFGKIRKTHRIDPHLGTLTNVYYFVGLDTGLIPREMNAPCSNPISVARKIFQQEELDVLGRKHAVEKAAILAEKETEQLYSALLEEKLIAAGIDLPDKREPVQVEVSADDAESFVAERIDDPPSQILATPTERVITERTKRVAEKVKNEWSWMHYSFTRIGMNINGAIRYFARSEETEGDLDFQVANYYAGEEAKNRPRPSSHRDDRQDPGEHSILIWDGGPPESEAEKLWQDVLEDLQARLPRPSFETWLRPTVGMAIETGETDALVVAAQSALAVEWLERRIFHSLSTALEKAAGKPIELQLRARKPDGKEEPTQEELCPGQQLNEGGELDLNGAGERRA